MCIVFIHWSSALFDDLLCSAEERISHGFVDDGHLMCFSWTYTQTSVWHVLCDKASLCCVKCCLMLWAPHAEVVGVFMLLQIKDLHVLHLMSDKEVQLKCGFERESVCFTGEPVLCRTFWVTRAVTLVPVLSVSFEASALVSLFSSRLLLAEETTQSITTLYTHKHTHTSQCLYVWSLPPSDVFLSGFSSASRTLSESPP